MFISFSFLFGKIFFALFFFFVSFFDLLNPRNVQCRNIIHSIILLNFVIRYEVTAISIDFHNNVVLRGSEPASNNFNFKV